MTRFVGYIAMSIDGRIADAKGGMDWLTPFTDPGNDYGYADFYAGIDAIVMGRTTYDFVSVQPEWPYPDKPVYVVTSRTLGKPQGGVTPVPADYDALRADLLAGPHQRIWVMGGGHTQRGALDAGMFDELHLFVMPVVLGGGPLVFADGPPADARLTDHTIHPGGIAALTYTF